MEPAKEHDRRGAVPDGCAPFFVSGAEYWPNGPAARLHFRPGVQNKAHRFVLVLINYCQGIADVRKLRLSLQGLKGKTTVVEAYLQVFASNMSGCAGHAVHKIAER